MPKIYLAGPINGLSYEEATNWRKDAQRYLQDFGITGVSPMRAKEFLSDHKDIGITEFSEPLASDAGIVARDRFDVQNADLMLVNLLGATKVSCGTPCEYGWADAFGVPIITVMEESGNPYDHPFVRRLSGYRVTTLEEGLDLAAAILTT